MSKFSKAWPESAWPQHQPLDTLSVHDLAALRKVIASVIADGPWEFTVGQDCDVRDYERQQRHVLTETIITRIIATAAPSLREETTDG